MSEIVLKQKGRFQIWHYTNGHGQLLLRSPKSAERDTQVDILFVNVAAIHLPSNFEDVQVEVLDPQSVPFALQLGTLSLADRKAYRLSGLGFDGYVVAGAVTFDERDAEYHAPSELIDA